MKNLLCLGLLVASACSKKPVPEIQVDVGPDSRKSFAPVAAFAEYVELPGLRNELRITLASYAASCDRFVSPGPSDVLLTATVVTPASERPGVSAYLFSGPSERAHAELSVRFGAHAQPLSPAGTLSLTRTDLEAQGSIEGELGFDAAGDPEHPPQSVRGRFAARLCRVNTAGGP